MENVDLFDACTLVVLNDSVCRPVPITGVLCVACEGRLVGRSVSEGIGEAWGPLHWAPGIEWITESPRAAFKELIGLGAVATTPTPPFHFASPHCVFIGTDNDSKLENPLLLTSKFVTRDGIGMTKPYLSSFGIGSKS